MMFTLPLPLLDILAQLAEDSNEIDTNSEDTQDNVFDHHALRPFGPCESSLKLKLSLVKVCGHEGFSVSFKKDSEANDEV